MRNYMNISQNDIAKGRKKLKERFQIRQAAGEYWLLDMQQDGRNYKRPIRLNQMGAEVVRLLLEQKSREEIAELLGKQYGVESKVILDDMEDFFNQLDVV